MKIIVIYSDYSAVVLLEWMEIASSPGVGSGTYGWIDVGDNEAIEPSFDDCGFVGWIPAPDDTPEWTGFRR